MAEMTLSDVAKMMRDIDFCMLSTRTDGGALAARPMSNNREVEYDGDSYFFSDEAMRSVSDITREPKVGLSFQGTAGILGQRPFMLAVEGTAELVRDTAAFDAHWTSGLDRWFEQGTATPGLVMIKVHAQRIHYWNGYDEGEIAIG